MAGILSFFGFGGGDLAKDVEELMKDFTESLSACFAPEEPSFRRYRETMSRFFKKLDEFNRTKSRSGENKGVHASLFSL